MAIESAAVIGAGVMGMGIAAQLANAGIPVFLLDIVPDGATERNQLAQQALAQALRVEPAPFMHKRNAKLIRCGNLEDDLDAAGACDWVVEAVVERLDIKQALFARLEAVRGPRTIVSSNTSTIPLAYLVDGRNDEFCANFLITHFFNPPRYMRLLELVTGAQTAPEVRERMRDFVDIRLGKGVVDCHDTPGFIANRIGTFWMQAAIRGAIELNVSVEEADAVLSAPFGVPKTGVFGLVDLVGLDLMPHIMSSMRALLDVDDAMLRGRNVDDDLPHVIRDMIANGYTGRKGKGGFYRLIQDGEKRLKEAVDLGSGEYRVATNPRLAAVAAARSGGMRAVLVHPSAAGQLAWQVMSATILYAAELVPAIADRASSIDTALELGYSWQRGPFALLDAVGTEWFCARVEAEGRALPPFLLALRGTTVFSAETAEITEQLTSGGYAPVRLATPVKRLQDYKRQGTPVARNGSATLWDVQDGVACLEFHSKMNAIDPGIMAMLNSSIKIVPQQFQALVIHNESDNFSIGANVGLLLFAANMAAWQQIDATVAAGQQTYHALKYAPFPVVGAPSGMALGGGCEVLLHCDAVQAHAETYLGLVEVGVGLVPGLGGCKELLLRWFAYSRRPQGPMPALSKVFEYISTAQVAKSAQQARDILLLQADDRISMNRDRLLHDAKLFAVELAANYSAPTPAESIRLPGETARVAMNMVVDGFHKMGKATTHDCVVAAELAQVLSGGNTDIIDEVSEQQLFDLERQALLRLVRHPGTLARLEHMLATGKPLRN